VQIPTPEIMTFNPSAATISFIGITDQTKSVDNYNVIEHDNEDIKLLIDDQEKD
jgi:hypothetical protein